jgi:hypothetical protein
MPAPVPWAEQAVAIFRRVGNDRRLRRCSHRFGTRQSRPARRGRPAREAVELGRLDDDVASSRALNYVAHRSAPATSSERDINREELDRWTALGSKRGEATGSVTSRSL